VDLVLQALSKVENQDEIICLDGPVRSDQEQRFRVTNTIFTAYLTGTPLAQVYASADIFVFPGANDTFGNVVLEARASGLPVVAPKTGGVPDLEKRKENSYLFGRDDIISLMHTTRLLINSPTIALRWG
jgi:glycosyltransferase involved in cell wall biosynthesis